MHNRSRPKASYMCYIYYEAGHTGPLGRPDGEPESVPGPVRFDDTDAQIRSRQHFVRRMSCFCPFVQGPVSTAFARSARGELGSTSVLSPMVPSFSHQVAKRRSRSVLESAVTSPNSRATAATSALGAAAGTPVAFLPFADMVATVAGLGRSLES